MAINPDFVRYFIRDDANLNILLNNEEQFTDDEIGFYEELISDEVEINFPALRNKALPKTLIIYGILEKLLASEGNKENRNQMNISDDNVGTIDLSNKASQYFNIASTYEAKFKSGCESLCASDWYRNLWGSVDSLSAEIETGSDWDSNGMH